MSRTLIWLTLVVLFIWAIWSSPRIMAKIDRNQRIEDIKNLSLVLRENPEVRTIEELVTILNTRDVRLTKRNLNSYQIVDDEAGRKVIAEKNSGDAINFRSTQDGSVIGKLVQQPATNTTPSPTKNGKPR